MTYGHNVLVLISLAISEATVMAYGTGLSPIHQEPYLGLIVLKRELYMFVGDVNSAASFTSRRPIAFGMKTSMTRIHCVRFVIFSLLIRSGWRAACVGVPVALLYEGSSYISESEAWLSHCCTGDSKGQTVPPTSASLTGSHQQRRLRAMLLQLRNYTG